MRYLNAASSWTTYQVTGPGAVSSDPVIMHAAGDTNIAAAAPDGSLRFWWAPDRTGSWHEEYVGGPVASGAAPAITDSGTATHIAAVAPDGSLWFYWVWDGTSTWHAEQVAGPTAVTSAPAMTESSAAVEIAATGPDATVWFYWASIGTPTWHAQQVGGSGASQAAPAIADSGTGVYIVTIDTASVAFPIYYGDHGSQIQLHSWIDIAGDPCLPTAPAAWFGTSLQMAITTGCSPGGVRRRVDGTAHRRPVAPGPGARPGRGM
jgi:hypothetical protein